MSDGIDMNILQTPVEGNAYRIEIILTTQEPLTNVSLMGLASEIEGYFIGVHGGRPSVQFIDMKKVSVTRGSADEDTRADGGPLPASPGSQAARPEPDRG